MGKFEKIKFENQKIEINITDENSTVVKEMDELYKKYNITDDEDEVLSNWDEKDSEVARIITDKYTPERATELLTVRSELKAISKRIIESIASQFRSHSDNVQTSEFLQTRRTEEFDTLMKISSKDFRSNIDNKDCDNRISITKNGNVVAASDFEKAIGALGTSTKKLGYKVLGLISTDINNANEITLDIYEYAEMYKKNIDTEYQKKNWCKKIKKDLEALKHLDIKTKRNGTTSLISRIEPLDKNGCYTLEVPLSTREALRFGAWINVPICMWQLDDKSPNSFSIGVKLNTYFYNRRSIAKGTNKTLSISKILEHAPEIMSIQEYLEKNRQNHFKSELKAPLEKALDELVDVGYLLSWNYRAPKGIKKYNREEVAKMTFKEFKELMIVFVPKVVDGTALESQQKCLESNIVAPRE